ncbi:DUF3052 family protein [Streptomyces sp. H72]
MRARLRPSTWCCCGGVRTTRSRRRSHGRRHWSQGRRLIWLVTPKTGREGYVEPSDVHEECRRSA